MSHRNDFDHWLDAVDEAIFELAGVGLNDLADQAWYDWWSDEYTPQEAAYEALENEGFPFE